MPDAGNGSCAGSLAAGASPAPLRWDESASRCVRAAGLVRLCARSRGDRSTTIAVIDGAVSRSHPSLREAQVEVVDEARTTSVAASEHATFIASAFAGIGPRCLGLAPACPILNIGVVDEEMLRGATSARKSAARLASAVDLASARGARIIQISLDLWFDAREARPLIDAIRAAVGRAAVVVVAAGQGQLPFAHPLFFAPGVIPVSGADRAGRPIHSLHRSGALNVSGVLAPAVDVPGAVLPTGTALRSGTSFAACFVTAAVALMCSAIAGMTARDAARRLLAARAAPRREALPVPLDADGCFEPFRSIQEVADVRYF